MTPVLRTLKLHGRNVWTWFDKLGEEHGPYISERYAQHAAKKNHAEENIKKSLHKKKARENKMTVKEFEKKLKEAKAWPNISAAEKSTR